METELFTPAVIWFLVGAGLLILELLVPGLILLFFGVGAWITAAILLGFDLGLNAQLLIFSLTSLGSLFSLRQSIRKKYMDSQDNGIASLNNDFIGKTAKTISKIAPKKEGKVEFNGSHWKATSDIEIDKDCTVKIIGTDSIKLIVKPL